MCDRLIPFNIVPPHLVVIFPKVSHFGKIRRILKKKTKSHQAEYLYYILKKFHIVFAGYLK